MVDDAVTYPVLWAEPNEAPVTGTLTLGRDSVELDGGRHGQLVRRSIAHRDLAGIRIGRATGDRLGGRSAIVVERHDAPSVLVRPLGLGLLNELADLLTHLCAQRVRVDQIAIVLPLRRDAIETAAALVADGPPFDPADADIERHEVFLTEHEAVFVFTGTNACASVRRFAEDTAIWRAADRWASCLAGPPRLADVAFSYTAEP